jgi:hypothetical protein
MFNLKICSQQTCSDVERDSLEEEDESKVHKPSKVNTIFKFYLLSYFVYTLVKLLDFETQEEKLAED